MLILQAHHFSEGGDEDEWETWCTNREPGAARVTTLGNVCSFVIGDTC